MKKLRTKKFTPFEGVGADFFKAIDSKCMRIPLPLRKSQKRKPSFFLQRSSLSYCEITERNMIYSEHNTINFLFIRDDTKCITCIGRTKDFIGHYTRDYTIKYKSRWNSNLNTDIPTQKENECAVPVIGNSFPNHREGHTLGKLKHTLMLTCSSC